MSHPRGRGPYATMACTNCRQRHAKCSEESTCAYCASHKLTCVYVKSVKKRGPKATNRTVFEQEHQFGISMPSYFEYGEEPQPIQSGAFLNQNIINFSDTFSLPNNTISFSVTSSYSPSSSIASNLDYLFRSI
ncbi:fungal specific transcription factor [Gigaspora margarita]|uniref:Fungal specific transcription factor n=1 Tax=Gigaspora margarita TaxID=4874 RepID=A0A8H4AKN9_GIGMA|nr:fungal specific transcription factor [Gigaspora margarita]